MTTDFITYKQNYQKLIDQVIVSTHLDGDLKDDIYQLLYFLHQYPELLTD